MFGFGATVVKIHSTHIDAVYRTNPLHFMSCRLIARMVEYVMDSSQMAVFPSVRSRLGKPSTHSRTLRPWKCSSNNNTSVIMLEVYAILWAPLIVVDALAVVWVPRIILRPDWMRERWISVVMGGQRRVAYLILMMSLFGIACGHEVAANHRKTAFGKYSYIDTMYSSQLSSMIPEYSWPLPMGLCRMWHTDLCISMVVWTSHNTTKAVNT